MCSVRCAAACHASPWCFTRVFSFFFSIWLACVCFRTVVSIQMSRASCLIDWQARNFRFDGERSTWRVTSFFFLSIESTVTSTCTAWRIDRLRAEVITVQMFWIWRPLKLISCCPNVGVSAGIAWLSPNPVRIVQRQAVHGTLLHLGSLLGRYVQDLIWSHRKTGQISSGCSVCERAGCREFREPLSEEARAESSHGGRSKRRVANRSFARCVGVTKRLVKWTAPFSRLTPDQRDFLRISFPFLPNEPRSWDSFTSLETTYRNGGNSRDCASILGWCAASSQRSHLAANLTTRSTCQAL